ncbi:MAG: carbohydrate ABC transporter permease [Clostridia bacterium]|nr:carbohydrate ABC transporter permease [Clostridia bacterium]
MVLITVTMYFHAGMIPTYLLVYNLGLIDHVWALILPCVLNTFNMIMMRTFFKSVPVELEEAAMIDGCNDFQVLWNIMLPVSKPILATIALFYAVQRWNSFSDALYYINNPKLYPLQLKLQQIIQQGQADNMMSDINSQLDVVVPKTVQAASIIFATIPILLVYPKLQKYFVKGAMIGAVKG